MNIKLPPVFLDMLLVRHAAFAALHAVAFADSRFDLVFGQGSLLLRGPFAKAFQTNPHGVVHELREVLGQFVGNLRSHFREQLPDAGWLRGLAV
jgi:hypothetical protein